MRSFTDIRKEAGLFCRSFLRKGELFAFDGLSENLKDLKDQKAAMGPKKIATFFFLVVPKLALFVLRSFFCIALLFVRRCGGMMGGWFCGCLLQDWCGREGDVGMVWQECKLKGYSCEVITDY